VIFGAEPLCDSDASGALTIALESIFQFDIVEVRSVT
jgi:hypothetical protein